MKAQANTTGEYRMLSTRELLALVADKYQASLKSAFGLAVTQLEAARKVENDNPEIEKVCRMVKKMQQDFEEHAGKEARLLYPLFTAEPVAASYEDLAAFVAELITEHEQQRRALGQLNAFTKSYQCDPPASPAHKLAYAHLNDLEQDFHRMVFLEEEYLFPRLLQLNASKKRS